MIVAFVFIFLLAGAGGTIFIVLGNFEQLSEEGITFEKVPGYVALDGVSLPVARNRQFSHYMFMDAKIVLKDRSDADIVFAEMPFFRDRVLRDLHLKRVDRDDGVPGVDIRAVKERMSAIAIELFGEEVVDGVLVTKLILSSN
jgi:hypothetical protein